MLDRNVPLIVDGLECLTPRTAPSAGLFTESDFDSTCSVGEGVMAPEHSKC